MKKITILLGAALLFAGAANAQGPTNNSQGPTNVYKGAATRAVAAPVNPNTPNSEVTGASQGSFNMNYQSYSQDSYINQAGNTNNATVNQTDGRSARATGGSSASIDQTGDRNTANQTQTLVNGTAYSSNNAYPFNRSFSGATQAGSNSQSDQVQTGGGENKQVVLQGAGTTANRAIQTQSIDASGHGAGNIATINQRTYAPVANSGSGNRAEQDQSGYNQNALIDQESRNSFAKQTQRDGADGGLNGNDALIHQGAPGEANTALQVQGGVRNSARIQQGVFTGALPASADNNFARQTQSNRDNDADIFQGSSNNYAEQVQTGVTNYSSMDQRNVSSAAYSIQSGNRNSANVTQR